MENQTTHTTAVDVVIKQVINNWAAQNKRVNDFFGKHTDDAYLNEVAPGRNRAIYLLGHLIAVNDGILPLLGISERLFPQYQEPFLAADSKSMDTTPSLSELKKNWETLNATLTNHFNKMTPNEWLDRHTSVSAEDFVLDPTRNKLNILITRTIHQSYHLGQLNFLPVKELVA